MLDIIRRPLALRDTKDIWLYTRKNWGESQANRYLDGLQQTIVNLAQAPKQGRALPVLQGQYYRYFFKVI